MVRLHVKTLTGRTLTLEAEKEDTVAALKASIAALPSFGCDGNMRLMYLGRDMEAVRELGSYGMDEAGTFTLHILPPAPPARAQQSLPAVSASDLSSKQEFSGSFVGTAPPFAGESSHVFAVTPRPAPAAHSYTTSAMQEAHGAASAALQSLAAAARDAGPAETESATVRGLRVQVSMLTAERDSARAEVSSLRDRLARCEERIQTVASTFSVLSNLALAAHQAAGEAGALGISAAAPSNHQLVGSTVRRQ